MSGKTLLLSRRSCQRPTTYQRRLLYFRALGAILRAALLAARDANGVQCAANDVISDSGEIFYAASANQHDGVLLQIVADAGNVGGDLDSVGQADAGNFAQRGIWLLRRLSIDTGADTAFLRTSLQRRAGCLISRTLADIAY